MKAASFQGTMQTGLYHMKGGGLLIDRAVSRTVDLATVCTKKNWLSLTMNFIVSKPHVGLENLNVTQL